jgi:hypothetical protein
MADIVIGTAALLLLGAFSLPNTHKPVSNKPQIIHRVEPVKDQPPFIPDITEYKITNFEKLKPNV